eukprot:PhM_4_TR18868/c5_g1_i2/m.104968
MITTRSSSSPTSSVSSSSISRFKNCAVEKLYSFFFSLRTIPTVMCLTVLIVTAVLCSTTTLRATNVIVTETRTLSTDSIESLSRVALDTNKILVRRYMSGLHAGAFGAVLAAINELERVIRRYQTFLSLATRNQTFSDPNITTRTPEFMALMRQMMYSDMQQLDSVAYMAYIIGNKTQMLVAHVPGLVPPAGQHRSLGLIFSPNVSLHYRDLPLEDQAKLPASVNKSTIYTEYCPLDNDAKCDNSVVGEIILELETGQNISMPYSNFPLYVNTPDFSTSYEWILKNAYAYFANDGVLWTLDTGETHYNGGTIIFDDPPPSVFSTPYAGFALGFNVISLSSTIQSLPQTSAQRVFLVVAGYNLWWDPTDNKANLPGQLIAASHGRLGRQSITPTGLVFESIYVEESSDALIQSAGLFIKREYNNSYISLDKEDILEFTIGMATYFLRSVVLTMPSGIVWSVVVVVPHAEVLGDIESQNRKVHTAISENEEEMDKTYTETQLWLLIAVCATGAIVFLLAHVFTLRFTRHLMWLKDDMAHIAVMELNSVDLKRHESHIVEVRSMQISFKKMVRDLKDYRAFMPQAILQANEEEEDDNNMNKGNSNNNTTNHNKNDDDRIDDDEIVLESNNNNNDNNNNNNHS